MKKLTFFLVFLFPLFLFAQTHNLILKDGQKLKVNIVELNDNTVTYVNPIYPKKQKTIDKNKIDKITKIKLIEPPTPETLLGYSNVNGNLSNQEIIVDGVNLNELPIRYIQILATGKLFSNKVTINIDFGQRTKWIQGKGSVVKGANGKAVIFNSVLHAINFFGNNGWKFVHAFPITVGNQHVYHYTFERDE